MSDLERLVDLVQSLMTTLAPILKRADEANLISATEQAELTTLLFTASALFLDTGGTEQELLDTLEPKGDA